MKYRELKNWKYQLMEDCHTVIEISETASNDYIALDQRHLIIKRMYAWDGSTIPFKRMFKLFGWDVDKHSLKASLVHDALTQLIGSGLLPNSYRQYADGLYRDMSVAAGLSEWKGAVRYWLLRKYDKLKSIWKEVKQKD